MREYEIKSETVTFSNSTSLGHRGATEPPVDTPAGSLDTTGADLIRGPTCGWLCPGCSRSGLYSSLFVFLNYYYSFFAPAHSTPDRSCSVSQPVSFLARITYSSFPRLLNPAMHHLLTFIELPPSPSPQKDNAPSLAPTKDRVFPRNSTRLVTFRSPAQKARSRLVANRTQVFQRQQQQKQ